MKIFLDTANVDEIRRGAELGLVDGVTTNPSLVAKEKRKFKECILEICSLVSGPVSAEVVATDAEGILKEARELASWAPNVVVKVPMIPEGLKAVKRLSAEGIKTNVTLCFSANQALLAAKAGAAYVSPFVGRLDDIGQDGMIVVREILQIFAMYKLPTQVIAASLRHPTHVKQAAFLGAHIATIPYSVFDLLFKHALTDSGLRRFLDDWANVKDLI